MFQKCVKFAMWVLLASPVGAQANMVTTNRAQAAYQIMRQQGSSQSDWGQTRRVHCLEMSFDGKTSLFRCLGEYRTMGPEEADFWFAYRCDIPFHATESHQFQVIDSEVHCQ
jgi:hypothetical protein